MATSSYDYVIIGGGTTGLVVANRLSEDPNQRVLVLEAGSDLSEDPRVRTPAIFTSLLETEADWDFRTEPQPNLRGRSIKLNQGKALGGSSAINAHIFVPPGKGSIDAWGSLGNEGWNWDILRGYLSKTYTSPLVDDAFKESLGIDEWSGRSNPANGPIKTSFSGHLYHPIRRAWAEVFEACSSSMASDPFLDSSSAGCFSVLASIDPENRERSYAVSAYYNPIRDRPNLQVLTNAVVEKIVFDDDQPPKATGVQYIHDNETKTVVATKEVVLAAGALQSPKLLELSGIGDAKLLEGHGIEVVQNLPQVGENLQDHLVCYISYEAFDDVETLDVYMTDPEAAERARMEYETNRSGTLSSVGFYTYAYLPLVKSLSGKDHETLKELLRQNRPPVGTDPSQERARIYHELAENTILHPTEPTGAYLTALTQLTPPVEPNSDSPTDPVPGKFITFGVMLSQPLSRGSVHIVSDQVSSPPAIDPNYLSNPLDLEVFARHMQYAETLASSPAFSKLLKQPLRRRDPASDSRNLDRAKKYVQTSAISIWHVGGTCAMLPREKGGVVDPQLRVYGTQSLRVVDASAIPLISTANLQATVYAFAERAAELIKDAHGLK
ncbi:hypothetical protein Hte_007599 [Hypoxylon texense]